MSSDSSASIASSLTALSATELSQLNHHLAALATAGLPLEQGIRLAAGEATSRRVRAQLDALAADLESGVSLADAFDRRRGALPSMYAALMSAAVATGNLPALLLTLGRHQRTSDDLRAALSRALTYPLTLLAGTCVVAACVARFVLPQMARVYDTSAASVGLTRWSWSAPPPRFPVLTTLVIAVGPYLAYAAALLAVVLLLVPVALPFLRRAKLDAKLADMASRLPLWGPAIRASAVARFADALAVCVSAPADLPRALRLAGGVVGYPRVIADAEALAAAVESGRSPRDAVTRLLPRTLPEVIAGAAENAALPESLEALALLYRQQAEAKAQRIPVVLLPIALAVVGFVVAILLMAITLPLSYMLRSLV